MQLDQASPEIFKSILDKPLAYDQEGLKGVLADFGPFTKKLRIVGYFEQKI